MILNSTFQAVEKPKKFTSRAAEDFASLFIKKIVKLIKVVKTREKRQKTMFSQLFKSLNKPKLRSFFNKNRTSRKIKVQRQL